MSSSKQDYIAFAVLGLLGVAGGWMVMFATSRYGVGLTTVSADFLAATRGLLSGTGYVEHDGNPYLYYLPLFPLLLLPFALLGLDLPESVRYLNATTFGAIVLVVGFWLRRNVRSYPLVILGTLAVLISPPLLAVAANAWAETVYTLLVLLFLCYAVGFLKTGERSKLYACAAFASMATLTRLIGLAAIASGAVLVLTRRNTAPREKRRNLTVFLAVTVLPLVAWHARNYILYSRLSGEVGDSPTTFGHNLYRAVAIVTSWMVPAFVPSGAAVALLLITAVAAALLARRARYWRRGPPDEDTLLRLLPPLLYSATHVVFQAAASSRRGIDPLGERFLAPVYVPAVLVIVAVLDTVRTAPAGGEARRALRYTLAVFAVLLMLIPARRVARSLRNYSGQGAGGYATSLWQDSETIAYLRSTLPDGRIFTNESGAIYILTEVQARLTPRRFYFQTRTPVADDTRQLRECIEADGVAYVVWFHGVDRPYLLDLKELKQMFEFEVVSELADGSVYRVQRREFRSPAEPGGNARESPGGVTR